MIADSRIGKPVVVSAAGPLPRPAAPRPPRCAEAVVAPHTTSAATNHGTLLIVILSEAKDLLLGHAVVDPVAPWDTTGTADCQARASTSSPTSTDNAPRKSGSGAGGAARLYVLKRSGT